MRRTRLCGMTLMEVIVALGLSVALMALVGSALQFYAVTLNQRDEQVRRTTIARGVMQMICADLRAAVWSEPQDLSVVGEMLTSANGNAAATATGLGSTSATGTDESAGTEDATMEEPTLDLALNLSSTSRPGLIGTQSEILFDVSRLPRVDQMTMNMNALPSELQDVPSDLKTVSYHIQAAGAGGVPSPLNAVGTASEAGLVRRVIDREASKYANQMGDVTRLMQTGSLIAPEVIGLEFSYWDGTMWLTSWHSDDMGSLPLAVKVRISMQPRESKDATVIPSAEIFETIVRLPMASSMVPVAETTETTDAAALPAGQGTGSGSSSGSSGSTNGATGR